MEDGARNSEMATPVDISHDEERAPSQILPHEISRNEETLEQAFLEIDFMQIKINELQNEITFLKRKKGKTDAGRNHRS